MFDVYGESTWIVIDSWQSVMIVDYWKLLAGNW